MKKALKALGVICLSTIILAGCGSSEKESSIKDGTYYRYGGSIKVKLVVQDDEALRSVNVEGESAETGEIDSKKNAITWDDGSTTPYIVKDDTVEIESSTTGEMLEYFKEGSIKQQKAEDDWSKE